LTGALDEIAEGGGESVGTGIHGGLEFAQYLGIRKILVALRLCLSQGKGIPNNMSKTAKQLVIEHVLTGLNALVLNSADRRLQAEASEMASEMHKRLIKETRAAMDADKSAELEPAAA